MEKDFDPCWMAIKGRIQICNQREAKLSAKHLLELHDVLNQLHHGENENQPPKYIFSRRHSEIHDCMTKKLAKTL